MGRFPAGANGERDAAECERSLGQREKKMMLAERWRGCGVEKATKGCVVNFSWRQVKR